MLQSIFELFPAFSEIYGEDNAVKTLHIIGGLMISVSFLAIGSICLFMAGVDKTRSAKRVHLTRMFGWFLLCCSVSRGIDVLSIWQNYAVLSGIAKILTGLIAFYAVSIIPSIVREGIKAKTLNEVDRKLTETTEKLDKLSEISQKLDKK